MELRHAPPAPSIRVRFAREDDLERLVTVHAAAFPDARSREARRRNFTDNVRGSMSDLLVAERDGAIVGHSFLFRMGTWIGGRQVATGGVASLGVAPEARGSGVARALMNGIAQELRVRSTPLCLLYPFRHRFYRHFGFGLVSEVRRLRVPPSSFPAPPAGLEVRAASRPDDAAAVKRCYQRVAARTNGMLARREAVWRAALAPEGRQLVVVPGPGGEVQGYLLSSYLQPPDGLPQELDAIELVAETDSARLAIYGFFRAQKDQVPLVRCVVDARDPLLAVLEEPRGPSVDAIRSLIAIAGEVGAGAMMRIVDLPGALAARGYAAEGSLVLRALDPAAPGGVAACTLHARGGAGTVAAAAGGPTLQCDVGTLAQIFCAYLRPSDAVRLGRAAADSAATVAMADRIFDAPPFFPLDVF